MNTWTFELGSTTSLGAAPEADDSACVARNEAWEGRSVVQRRHIRKRFVPEKLGSQQRVAVVG